MKLVLGLSSLLFVFVLCFGALAASTAFAEDPAKIMPENYKVIFENERVRVLEFRDKPGEKGQMHSHPDHLGYTLAPLKRQLTGSDGKTEEIELKAGEVVFIPATSHQGENTGTTDSHVLVIELKN